MPHKWFGRKLPAPTPAAAGGEPAALAGLSAATGGDADAGMSSATEGPPILDGGVEMSSNQRPNYPAPLAGPALPAAGPLRGEVPRRVVEVAGSPFRRLGNGNGHAGHPAPYPFQGHGTEARKLIVGRDISLCGEIGACDMLVVEGLVEATLRDGRLIEITDTGFFKGSVEIDEADLAGRFEGELVVRGRMRVRSTGRVFGTIRYGELEVEAGGQIIGDVQVVPPGRHLSTTKPASADKPIKPAMADKPTAAPPVPGNGDGV